MVVKTAVLLQGDDTRWEFYQLVSFSSVQHQPVKLVSKYGERYEAAC